MIVRHYGARQQYLNLRVSRGQGVGMGGICSASDPEAQRLSPKPLNPKDETQAAKGSMVESRFREFSRPNPKVQGLGFRVQRFVGPK